MTIAINILTVPLLDSERKTAVDTNIDVTIYKYLFFLA